MHRWAQSIASAIALTLSVTSCSDQLTPRADRAARVAIVPEMSVADQSIFRSLSSGGLDVDNVHVMLFRPNSEATLVDTVVPFPVTASQVSVQLAVQLDEPEEQLSASVDLRAQTTTLFTGSQTVVARVGQTSDAKPVSLTYVGPGASARLLHITPRTTATYVGGRTTLIATATDLAGAIVPLPIGWFSSNAAVATIDGNGTITGVSAGSAAIIAKGLTGIADTAFVTVTPPAARLVPLSGDAQSAVVGRNLPNLLVVQALTTSGTGVPGVPVTFRVTSGNGSFDTQTLNTDDNGVVSNALSLGTAAGAVTVEATSGTLNTLFHVTALPDVATSLRIASGGSQTAQAGTALASPLVVRAVDQYGNSVPNTVVLWIDNLGGQLSATQTVTGADGTTSVNYTVGRTGVVSAMLSSERGQVDFNITAIPGPVAQLIPVGFASAYLGGLTSAAPAVQVADAYGNPLAIQDVTVFFAFDVSDTSSVFSPTGARSASAATDSKGVAVAPAVVLNSQHDITINANATVGTTRIQGSVTVFYLGVLPARIPSAVTPLGASTRRSP